MNPADQKHQAESFRARHRRKPILLLPNAWDAISARLLVAAGFDAIATTSAGVAWALGYADGQKAPWREVVEMTARIVRVAGVPVTADIEQGYGDTPDGLARSIGEIVGAGVVGVNLEDGLKGGAAPLRSIEDAAARIRAARAAATAAGVPIVINGRTDLYLLGAGDAASRFEESVARGKAYLAAGADCVYPIGLADPAVIPRFVQAVGGPVNIMAASGVPSLAELEALGVARVTTASGLTRISMTATRRAAEELRATGRFDLFAEAMKHPEAQALFTQA
jgi:2-methylisocitrate lyase-like PEP mutase family enzyme